MITYGLVGKKLSHSFSKKYFDEKFEKEKITNTSFINIELDAIEQITSLLKKDTSLKGFAITIPYKQSIISLLNNATPEVKIIQACNCVSIKNGNLFGYNTDWLGFKQSLFTLLQQHHNKAIIFGTGGASKAVVYVLQQLNIQYLLVSRTQQKNAITYNQLTQQLIATHPLIINTTPVGTYPNVHDCLDIAFEGIGRNHLCYDLIYNPTTTKFLQLCANNGATIKNGYDMLALQAEENWKIWNS